MFSHKNLRIKENEKIIAKEKVNGIISKNADGKIIKLGIKFPTLKAVYFGA